MTADEWKQVEDALLLPYGGVALNADGYALNLVVQQSRNSLKFQIVVYVNGWIKGEWVRDDCEERRRFLRPFTIAAYKPSEVARLTKGLSKRAIKQYFPDLDKRICLYDLAWPSFRPLKRHLIANNKVITLGSS